MYGYYPTTMRAAIPHPDDVTSWWGAGVYRAAIEAGVVWTDGSHAVVADLHRENRRYGGPVWVGRFVPIAGIPAITLAAAHAWYAIAAAAGAAAWDAHVRQRLTGGRVHLAKGCTSIVLAPGEAAFGGHELSRVAVVRPGPELGEWIYCRGYRAASDGPVTWVEPADTRDLLLDQLEGLSAPGKTPVEVLFGVAS